LKAASGFLGHNFTGSDHFKKSKLFAQSIYIYFVFKNGEMARFKNPAERSGLKTKGFRTERRDRAAAGFCATRVNYRTRPSFQR